jgi:hypothetical protein
MVLRKCALEVCLALMLLPGLAWAGRPLETEDTGTVEPGQVEVAASTEFVKATGQRTGTGVLSVTVGLMQGFDAHLDASGFVTHRDGQSTDGGFAEAAVGLKYRLLDETEQRPAVLTALTLVGRPKATQQQLEGADPAADGLEVEARLAVSTTMGPVTLTGNGGYAFTTDGTTVHAMLLGLSAEYRTTPALSLVAETFSEITFDGAGPSVVARAGAVYAISDRVRVDGAVGVGLTRNSPDLTATLGVTFRF